MVTFVILCIVVFYKEESISQDVVSVAANRVRPGVVSEPSHMYSHVCLYLRLVAC